jgi:IS5 family transposase
VKNDLVVGLEDRHIKHLSETQPGRVSDIKIAVQEELVYPKDTHLYQDKGFQGYAPSGVIVHQPKKKPKGGDLTDKETENNRLISRVRMAAEHVIAGIKRVRIVKDIFRNQTLHYEDVVMEVACGLHNFRTDYRLLTY